jgi:CheY-specific phosphatase CheX
MDKSVLTDAMKASISEVLAQMFFMPIEFGAPDKSGVDPQPDPETMVAKLGFSGLACGTFFLIIPASLALSVTADFLGVTSKDEARKLVAGTVLEMANMLAGSALSTYDHQVLFDLQTPELITVKELHALTEGVADQVVIRIQTPESRMAFQVVLQQAAAVVGDGG